jgi:hypothetical protein
MLAKANEWCQKMLDVKAKVEAAAVVVVVVVGVGAVLKTCGQSADDLYRADRDAAI